MSADNGIYILVLKDQCKVIHTQAIENLYWSHLTKSSNSEPNSARVVEYFYEQPALTLEEARNIAFEIEKEIMESDHPVLEYGISSIKIDKTWKELVTEAKEIAKLELVEVQTSRKTHSYVINVLNTIINM